MSDSERKIFPVETVLALVSGKEDADVREIAGYITGRSMVCPKMAKSVAAFAGAWLARLYPKFADMVYDGSEAWELFVNRCAAQLGDKISLPPMDGRIKESCLAALDAMDKAFAEVDALKAEVAKQAAEIEALKPLEGALEAAKKQADQLDAQLKAQKKDMGALRRQAAGFEGKIALDEEELLDTIKRTIKDNLKPAVPPLLAPWPVRPLPKAARLLPRKLPLKTSPWDLVSAMMIPPVLASSLSD